MNFIKEKVIQGFARKFQYGILIYVNLHIILIKHLKLEYS